MNFGEKSAQMHDYLGNSPDIRVIPQIRVIQVALKNPWFVWILPPGKQAVYLETGGCVSAGSRSMKMSRTPAPAPIDREGPLITGQHIKAWGRLQSVSWFSHRGRQTTSWFQTLINTSAEVISVEFWNSPLQLCYMACVCFTIFF